MTSPRTHQPATSKAAQEAVVNAAAATTPKTPARTGAAKGTVAKATPKTVAKPEAKTPSKLKTVKLSFGTVDVPDLTAIVSKRPTQQITDFLTWLQAATGVKFTAEQISAAALALPVGLRHQYQATVKDSNPSARKAAK